MERLKHDKYGRPIVYFAQWKNYYGAGSWCIFDNEEDAIFFVISGLGGDVDWATFPNPNLKYPDDERNGNESPQLTPLFQVRREVTKVAAYERSGQETGEVYRVSVASEWIVGNGIAEMSKQAFLQATGRDEVVLHGEGDKLNGRIKHHAESRP